MGLGVESGPPSVLASCNLSSQLGGADPGRGGTGMPHGVLAECNPLMFYFALG